MKKILITLFCTFITFSNLDSKAPKILWTKHFGGKESDRTYNICVTSDGGFLTCGQSNSFTKVFSTWLIKMDANGDTLWTKIIGDSALPEQIKSMEETSDGGYIACGGRMTEPDYAMHPYLIKLSSEGSLEWSKLISKSKIAESAIDALQTTDNGYVLGVWLQSGSKEMGIGIYKTDKWGNVIDSAFYDWDYYDKLESIEQTNDGGFVLAGSTNSFSFSTEFDEMFMLKLNSNLDSVWLKRYGINDSLSERLGSVIKTSDNGFLLIGAQAEYPRAQNDHNVFVVKTDKDGREEWAKSYGGNQHDVGFNGFELQNSDYILCGSGSIKNITGGFDAFIIRLNSKGDTIWTGFYGTPGYDELLVIKPVKAGGYILAGTSYYFSSNPNRTDLYFIRLADDATDIDFEDNSILVSKNSINISPNPFSKSTIINFELQTADRVKIDIFNSIGVKLTTLIDEWQDAGKHNYELLITNYEMSSGIYHYIVQIGNRIESGKLILIK